MAVKLDERTTVHDVPADACAACGEIYFDPEALRHISLARRRNALRMPKPQNRR
jgi:hypothetical protein